MIKALSLMLLLGSAAYAQPPIVIHGNAQGLWSPNGSVASMPTLPPQSRAPERSHMHTPPPPPPEVEEIVDITICPTYQSAPHLCEN